VLLSQHALRRARTVAGAVSVMLVIDPVVGLLAGIAWFDERVVVTPISLVSAVAAGAAVIAGKCSPTPSAGRPRHGTTPVTWTGHDGHPRWFA